MRKIKEVIVVEGRYDKNTLSQIVDATVITLGGFGVFNDKDAAEKCCERLRGGYSFCCVAKPE